MAKEKAITIVIIAILLGVYAMADLDTSDLDALPNCTTDNSIIKRNSTHWYCTTTHHAEMYWNSTNSTQLTITIPSIDTDVNITELLEGEAQGITTDDNYTMTINKDDYYLILVSMSIESNPASEYEVNIAINGINDKLCEAHQDAGDIENLKINCIEHLNTGDQITVDIRDETPPATDVNIHSLSWIILEIQ